MNSITQIYNKNSWLNTDYANALSKYLYDDVVIEVLDYLKGFRFKYGEQFDVAPSAVYLDPYEENHVLSNEFYPYSTTSVYCSFGKNNSLVQSSIFFILHKEGKTWIDLNYAISIVMHSYNVDIYFGDEKLRNLAESDYKTSTILHNISTDLHDFEKRSVNVTDNMDVTDDVDDVNNSKTCCSLKSNKRILTTWCGIPYEMAYREYNKIIVDVYYDPALMQFSIGGNKQY